MTNESNNQLPPDSICYGYDIDGDEPDAWADTKYIRADLVRAALPRNKDARDWMRRASIELSRLNKTCTWTDNDDGSWDTRCGSSFGINEGTPKDNNMKFCCYCGGKIDE